MMQSLTSRGRPPVNRVFETSDPRCRSHHQFRQAHVSQHLCATERRQRQVAATRQWGLKAASTGMEMETEAAIGKAVNLLKEAATTGGIPVAAVCQALVQLEKEKLADESYSSVIGGGKGGRRWKLVFTAGSKDVVNAQKGNRGGGFYVPITAVQRWEKEESRIQNGIYLGQLAALLFSGPYEYKKNKLSFDFNQIRLRLGPKWFEFNLSSMKKDKAGPFFIMVYADDEIVAARGRGGGIGLWQRTTPEWDLKSGLDL